MMPPFKNSIQLEITSADITGTLDELSKAGITLWDVETCEPITALFKISVTDLMVVRSIIKHRGDSFTVKNRTGAFWVVIKLKKRFIFLLGLGIILFLTGWLPTKILFYEVNGCSEEMKYAIIDLACNEGVYFGSDASAVKSNQLKNRIISQFPGVEWAGVTLRGCVAVIEVKQGSGHSADNGRKNVVSHIVAATDGIVESVTAEKGVAYCVPGQLVRKGQILISGYEDRGLSINATEAEGEIIAYTQRDITAVSPRNLHTRIDLKDRRLDYSLLIGKKQINLYNNSGISDSSCVKMYSREYLSLPGGFQLPIALIKEECYLYEMATVVADDRSFAFIEDQTASYIRGSMLAGQIMHKQGIIHFSDDLAYYSASYSCREQIGISKNEETLIHDRKYQ